MSIAFDEYLSIDTVDLGTHAYWCESLLPLFNLERRVPRDVMPYVVGGVTYRGRRNLLAVSLTVNVFGDVDADGVATADSNIGLRAHLDYLHTNLLADVTSPRSATWHLPDASTKTADVEVVAFTVRGGSSPAHALCALELVIPSGRFE